MKKLFFVGALALASLAPAQSISLSKAVKTSQNTDKFLYKVNLGAQSVQYLGEIDVTGATKNDPEIFAEIYKRAKIVGANAFDVLADETIDGTPSQINPLHYRLNLYYSTEFPKETNIAYLFSADAPVKLRVDGKRIMLQPRSYIKKVINYGSENYVAIGNFLGSKITLAAKEGQPAQYFQVSAFDVKDDQSGSGGINIKAGDIIGLERSYAEFLSVIYREQKY